MEQPFCMNDAIAGIIHAEWLLSLPMAALALQVVV
jgi:hypothetical protein